jgi:exonuclease SbcC
MIVTKLELKNFGGHEHLLVETDVPIVGLLGKNGAGKSTVLAAIQFALTNKLEGNSKTWIRRGQKSATVIMDFTKGGKKATIKRHMTTTSATREFTWDGQDTITADKAIKIELEKIFGSDKDAICNAVFISQGDLNELLFSGVAARYDLFIKVLNLSFCDKYSNLLIRKADKLMDGITDLSSNMDILKQQRRDAEENVKATMKELDSVSGFKPKYEWFIEFRNNGIDIEQGLEVIEKAKAQYMKSDEALAGRTVADAEKVVYTLEDSIESMQKAVSAIDEEQGVLKELLRVHKGLDENKQTRTTLENQLTALQSANVSQDSIRELRKQKETYDGQQRLAGLVKSTYETQVTANRQVEKLKQKDPGISDNDIKVLQDHLMKLTLELNILTQHHNSQKLILQKGGCGEDNCCMECGLKLDDSVTVSEESVATLHGMVVAKTADKDKVAGELEGKENQRKSYETELDEAVSAKESADLRLKEYQEQLSALGELMEDRDFDKEIKDAEEILHMITTHTAEKKQLEIVKSNLERELEKLPLITETESMKRQADLDVNKGKFEDRIVAEKKSLEVARDNYSQIQNMHSQRKADYDYWKKVLADQDAHKAKRTGLGDTMPFTDSELKSKSTAEWEVLLKTRAEEEDLVAGKLQEANSNLKRILDQILEIEGRMEANQSKMIVANELHTVADMFKKDGLPMTYINDKFVEIAELTQENLSLLEPDFLITIDPERPLSFLFERLNGEDSMVLTQDKMSGGQRVKLSIAFLMSIQQLLLPDFGFLVLDEPSLHLDEEAKEQLANLLTSMSGILQNTESQIWVCDHSPILERALNMTINLTYGRKQ